MGDTLTGQEKKLYDLLKAKIQLVASGELESTDFEFSAEEFFTKTRYTAEELGVTSISSDNIETVKAELRKKFTLDADFHKIIQALLADCPYDLYWFDKTEGTSYGSSPGYELSYYSSEIWITKFTTDIVVSMPVSADYAGTAGSYSINPVYGQSAAAAAANARQIVSDNRYKGDLAKLTSYRDEICSRVSYNHSAVNDGAAYGDPWQMVWVFDNDAETNVVCEGYSKAFQFLCDESAFIGNVRSIIVSGTMGGGTGEGRHMWNVVQLNNGKNYLADITNSDSGSIGQGGGLFLAGYSDTGTASDGSTAYIYRVGSQNIWYVYNEDTIALYAADDLSVANQSYQGLSGSCGENLAWEMDDAGVLTITGSGVMPGFGEGSCAPWFAGKQITSVQIGNGITSVGNYAFCPPSQYLGNEFYCAFTRVDLPASIISVGDHAFDGCSTLASVSLNDGLQTIGDNAFSNCLNLTDMTIPSGVTTIGDNAFFNCSKLTLGVYPDSPAHQYAVANNIPYMLLGVEYSWGEPEYEWSADNSEVTATRVCTSDPALQESETVSATAEATVPATCEGMGKTTYASAAFKNTAFAVQTKTVDIPALGHSWGEPEYAWSADNSGVTAERVCMRDPAHQESETVSAAEVTVPATCEGMGKTTYTSAAFENTAFAVQTKTVDIPALGHSWGEPEYEWSADNSGVTAERVCTRDPAHKESETVSAAEVTVPATCEGMGKTTYTGAFENAAFAVQTKTVDIPALGHSWGEPEYAWSADNSEVTATRICARDASHAETETTDAHHLVLVSPTETKRGVSGWRSDEFENPAFTVQKLEDADEIPSLGEMNVLWLPELKVIKAESFAGTAAQAVIVPDSCTEIEPGAFADCENLIYIRIPAGLEMPPEAVADCPDVLVDRK